MREFVAIAPRGVESVLASELESLGCADVRAERGAVRFASDLEQAYRVLFHVRTASRVLLPLVSFGEASLEALDEAVRSIPWLDHVRATGTLVVDVAKAARVEGHTRYVAQRTKDGVCDVIRARTGMRPSVDPENPDLTIHVHLAPDGGAIALDLAGSSLHRRGYRTRSAAAPLKENLAAAMTMIAGGVAACREGRPLVDPMCGTGTLLFEGTLAALDVAPGTLLAAHAVERWVSHDAAAFARVRREAVERARKGRENTSVRAFGYDASEEAVADARRVARELGLPIEFARANLEDVRAVPTLPPGVLVTNPPYGERLGTETELSVVYEVLGNTLRRGFAGYDAWVLTASRVLAGHLGLRAAARVPLWNGPLECRFLHFPISVEPPKSDVSRRRVDPEAEAFANRLRKNVRVVGKRAEREGLEAYRLYDADIPEYNVAVDRYADHVLVQEYAAPRNIDPAVAARRLRDAYVIVGETLEVPRDKLHLAVRRRQTSGGQYQREQTPGVRVEVREGDLRFEVRLGERLDTGLFPDHRRLRARMAEAARGKSFLNLFAYTCTASVAAAKAGARATTSVDLSQTYLDWAASNFARNAIPLRNHTLLRGDCLAYLREARGTFDVVFLNPPSYSRSHRMDTDFSIVRDQVPVLELAMTKVARGGELYFSTHANRFELDPSLVARFDVTDLSAESVPFDFERSPHRAYRLRHR